MNSIDQKRHRLSEILSDQQNDGLEALTVGQVMTTAPVAIGPDVSALEVVRKFHERQFRHLLVAGADGTLAGIISDRDVLRFFGPGEGPRRDYLATIPASRLMSTDLITVAPTTRLLRAVRLMLDNGINALPVVTDQRPVGIVTTTDLYLILEQLLQGDSTERQEGAIAHATSNKISAAGAARR